MLKILQARLQQYVNHELQMTGFRKGIGTRSNCQHPLDHRKTKRVPEKHLFLLYWLGQSLWLCGSQQTVENSEFSSVAQSCPTLCDPMDCILPGFSVHGILQARILEWVTISFSRRSSPPRDWTRVSEPPGKSSWQPSVLPSVWTTAFPV